MSKYRATYLYHDESASLNPCTAWREFDATSMTAAKRLAREIAKANGWRLFQVVQCED